MRLLGYKSQSSYPRLEKRLKGLNIQPSWNKCWQSKIPDNLIIEKAPKANSITALMKTLGLKPNGYAHARFKKRCASLGIDYGLDKYTPWNKGKKTGPKSVYSYLKPNTTIASLHRFKQKLLKAGLLEYKCYNPICNIKESWLGHKITLHLDHIDGDRTNCTLENLRLLCPNCHSQTNTYGRIKSYNPFQFEYDEKLFHSQYQSLCQSTAKLGTHIYCVDLMEYFHQHMWQMEVDGRQSAKAYWAGHSDKVLKNREKHCDKLTPRNVRRFFKLMNMVPSLFPDQLAKYLASLHDGSTVIDPFAGFSGRMLGVSSLGKKYVGVDLNTQTADGSNRINKLLNLGATIYNKDSREVELDGDILITSPPYYNKEDYGCQFKSVDDFNGSMFRIFSNFKASKYFIDFKSTPSYSVNDLIECLPLRVVDRISINFSGLFNKSVHTVLVCEQ